MTASLLLEDPLEPDGPTPLPPTEVEEETPPCTNRCLREAPTREMAWTITAWTHADSTKSMCTQRHISSASLSKAFAL